MTPARAGQIRRRLANPRLEWARSVVNAARARCLRTGMPFEITLAYVMTLDLPDRCPVFPAVTLDYGPKQHKGGADNAPSLDRIDNRRGYVSGNLRVISKRANRLKGDATPEERELLAIDARQCSETETPRR